MTHNFSLFSEPFEKIKSGVKDIEVRLYDEKRRKISVGNTIIFHKLPDKKETILVKVTGLFIFSNFEDLFLNFSNDRFGHYQLNLNEQIKAIRTIYNKEKEKQHGVLGIHVRLIKEV